jgi:hypothetical protein
MSIGGVSFVLDLCCAFCEVIDEVFPFSLGKECQCMELDATFCLVGFFGWVTEDGLKKNKMSVET